jgi:hypothetical protein
MEDWRGILGGGDCGVRAVVVAVVHSKLRDGARRRQAVVVAVVHGGMEGWRDGDGGMEMEEWRDGGVEGYVVFWEAMGAVLR